jgi:hypothetical protein
MKSEGGMYNGPFFPQGGDNEKAKEGRGLSWKEQFKR